MGWEWGGGEERGITLYLVLLLFDILPTEVPPLDPSQV